jgi:hypothetical protein
LYYGIYAHFDAYVDLLGEGANDFTANNYGLYMSGVDGFDVAGGNNNFNNSDVDVYLSSTGANIPLVGSNEVDLSGNRMRYCGLCGEFYQFGTVPNQNAGWYNQLAVGSKKYTYNPDYGQTFNACSGGTGTLSNYISEYNLVSRISSGLLVTVGGNNTNVIDATLEAAKRVTSSYGNEEADDELALEELDEITGQLLDEFSTLTNDEKRLVYINIRMMQKALGQLYAQHILTYNNGEENPPHSEVEALNDMIALLKSKYPSPADTADFERNTMLDLERVFAYRQGGFYSNALDILSGYPNHVSPRIFDKWSYWDCVCNAENNYLTGQIEQEQFAEDILYCQSMFSPRISLDEIDAEQPEVAERKPKFQFNVYPNPTGDFLYFRTEGLAGPEEIIRKEMFNLLGVKVYSEEAEASYLQEVDVRNLPSGSYILEVTGGGKKYQKKVVVN